MRIPASRGFILLIQCQREIACFPVTLQGLCRMIAGHLHSGVAELHQKFRHAGSVGGG